MGICLLRIHTVRLLIASMTTNLAKSFLFGADIPKDGLLEQPAPTYPFTCKDSLHEKSSRCNGNKIRDIACGPSSPSVQPSDAIRTANQTGFISSSAFDPITYWLALSILWKPRILGSELLIFYLISDPISCLNRRPSCPGRITYKSEQAGITINPWPRSSNLHMYIQWGWL